MIESIKSVIADIPLLEWLVLAGLITVITIAVRARILAKTIQKETPLMLRKVVEEAPLEYKEGYSRVELSNNKKCPLFYVRCKTKGCYAFAEEDGKFYCKQFMLEFTNYEAKND